MLNIRCSNNEDKINELLLRQEKLIEEIKKGQELQKILKNNYKILDKLYNL